MNKNAYVGILIAVLILGTVYYFLYARNGPERAGQNAPDDASETSQMPVTAGENPEPAVSTDKPVKPAAAAARANLAAKLKVANEKSIAILSVEEKTWSNGCLGLGGPDEMCSMALIDGFRVEMQVKGETYVYRTDKEGLNLRMESK